MGLAANQLLVVKNRIWNCKKKKLQKSFFSAGGLFLSEMGAFRPGMFSIERAVQRGRTRGAGRCGDVGATSRPAASGEPGKRSDRMAGGLAKTAAVFRIQHPAGSEYSGAVRVLKWRLDFVSGLLLSRVSLSSLQASSPRTIQVIWFAWTGMRPEVERSV